MGNRIPVCPLRLTPVQGNTLMDKFIRLTGDDARYDDGGRVAALGKVHQGLLQALKNTSLLPGCSSQNNRT